MGNLTGRVAVVTGGADGIGRGVVRRLAADGASVLIADIDVTQGSELADTVAAEFGIDALFLRTDVTQRAQVEAMVDAAVERWGRIDILINNAWGGGTIGRVEHKTDEQLAAGMAMGFYGPVWAMQRAFPHMKAAGYGRIVNLCSLNGVNAHMGTLEYNSSKEALRSASRTAAREWAPTGVTVNIVCPAAKSAAFNRAAKMIPGLEESADLENPMGRLGDPEQDIAPVISFLSSEDSRYLTGNTLFVDGGGHINGARWAPDLGE